MRDRDASRAPGRGSEPSVMGNAALVFRREFFTRITSSMFLATMAFALVFIIGGTFFVKVSEGGTDVVGVVGNQPDGLVEALPQLADDAGFEAVEVETFASRAELEDAIVSGEVRVGVVDGAEPASAELIIKTRDGTLPGFLSLVWQDARLDELAARGDLDPALRADVAAVSGQLPVTELEPDPESGAKQAVGIALVVMLFMTIQLMGGMLLMSITEEKGSNIVELLLSSMSSRSLLIGKLAANGVVGLVQIISLIGTAIIAVNVADLGDFPVIPPSLLLVALIWFLIGFALFGVLIAAGASLAPSQEDAQSVMMPIFLILIGGYVGSVYVVANPDASAARLLSLLPIVSPFAMPSRFLSDDLPVWEHGLALAVAIVSLAAVLNVGSRIYTRSVIHTERRLGWIEALRSEPIR